MQKLFFVAFFFVFSAILPLSVVVAQDRPTESPTPPYMPDSVDFGILWGNNGVDLCYSKPAGVGWSDPYHTNWQNYTRFCDGMVESEGLCEAFHLESWIWDFSGFDKEGVACEDPKTIGFEAIFALLIDKAVILPDEGESLVLEEGVYRATNGMFVRVEVIYDWDTFYYVLKIQTDGGDSHYMNCPDYLVVEEMNPSSCYYTGYQSGPEGLMTLAVLD